jgi:Arc/MetJ-type ribon-helix-helix transcriptional regulator
VKTISLKLPEHLDARLAALAQQRGGAGKSELIREAIERLIESDSTPGAGSVLDGMRDLVGKYRGPADLSSNPKYMEDFGRDTRNRRHRTARRRVQSK